MLKFLFYEIAPFESYTWQHYAPIIFFAVVSILIIRYAKKNLNEDQQYRLIFRISLLAPFLILAWIAHLFYTGTFDHTKDLPLFLCNIIAFVYPIIIYKRNRLWFGVFYFMVLAGTLQALITPDFKIWLSKFDVHSILVDPLYSHYDCFLFFECFQNKNTIQRFP